MPSGGSIAVIDVDAIESSSTKSFNPIALIALLSALAIFVWRLMIFSSLTQLLIRKLNLH